MKRWLVLAIFGLGKGCHVDGVILIPGTAKLAIDMDMTQFSQDVL
jgi:hypothetical protein